MFDSRAESVEALLREAATASDRDRAAVLLAEVSAEICSSPALGHLRVDLDRVRRELEAHR